MHSTDSRVAESIEIKILVSIYSLNIRTSLVLYDLQPRSKHRIDAGNSLLITVSPLHLSSAKCEIIKTKVDKILKLRVIEES